MDNKYSWQRKKNLESLCPSWMVLIWLLRASKWENDLSQELHLKTLWSSWMFIWSEFIKKRDFTLNVCIKDEDITILFIHVQTVHGTSPQKFVKLNNYVNDHIKYRRKSSSESELMLFIVVKKVSSVTHAEKYFPKKSTWKTH